MTESISNTTNKPLLAHTSFTGEWEKLTQWACANIYVYSDSDAQLTVNKSLNKVHIETIRFPIYAGQHFNTNILLDLPYFYLQIENTADNDQTILNVCTLYRNSYSYSKGSIQVFDENVSGTSSRAINLNHSAPNIAVFGRASSSCQLIVQQSRNGVDYYDTQYKLNCTADKDFGFNIPSGSYFFVRLNASTADSISSAFINFC
jgi:hypothetical protein